MENLMGDMVNFEGGNGVVGALGRPGWELEAKIDAKRLALDEGVVEEESELFFNGGKAKRSESQPGRKQCCC